MPEIDYQAIELLLLDVDGVLTDGRIHLSPRGEEMKVFNVRDGSGIKYWRRVGKKAAIVSGRGSPAVTRRAEELGIDAVRLNAKDKLPAFRAVLTELGFSPHQTAVMGDDLTDLPMLRRCGLAITPADAVQEVRSRADLVTQLPGGAGCVREAIERILKEAGLWPKILARYLPDNEDGRP